MATAPPAQAASRPAKRAHVSRRQLAATIGASDPQPLDRQPPTSERHLAGLTAVAHHDRTAIVLALRPDDLDDFLFHQLRQHAEPNADGLCRQPLFARADQLGPHASCTRVDPAGWA
jgi:hypothetical protein